VAKNDECNYVICRKMELKIIMLSEIRRMKKTNVTCSLSYSESAPTKNEWYECKMGGPYGGWNQWERTG
jgi:hypothetical protein